MKHKCFLLLFAVCVITSEIPEGYDEFPEIKQPEIQYSDFGTPIVPTYTEIQCTMGAAVRQHCSCPRFITSEPAENMCPRIQDCCKKDWSDKDEFGYGEFCSAFKEKWGEGLLSVSRFSNQKWFGSIAVTGIGLIATSFIPDPVTKTIVATIGSMAQSLYETMACYYDHGYYLASFAVRVNELLTKSELWREERVRHFSTPLDSDPSGIGILSAFRICGIPTLYSILSNTVLLPTTFLDEGKINAAMKIASNTISWIMNAITMLFGGLPQVGASKIAEWNLADETWDEIWQNTNYGTFHHFQKALHILFFLFRKIGYFMRRLKTVLEGLIDDVIVNLKRVSENVVDNVIVNVVDLLSTSSMFWQKLVDAIADVFAQWSSLSSPNDTPNYPEDNTNQFQEVIRILKEFRKRTLYLVNRLYCNCFKEKDKDVMERSKYCRPGTPESMEYHWYFSPDEIHDTNKLGNLTTKMWGKVMGPHFSSWETIRDCFRDMEPMQREYIMKKVQGLLWQVNVEHANIPPVLKIENDEGPFVNVFWSCPNNHDPKFAMCQTYHSKKDDSFLKIEASDQIPELCPTKTEREEQRQTRKGRRFF